MPVQENQTWSVEIKHHASTSDENETRCADKQTAVALAI